MLTAREAYNAVQKLAKYKIGYLLDLSPQEVNHYENRVYSWRDLTKDSTKKANALCATANAFVRAYCRHNGQVEADYKLEVIPIPYQKCRISRIKEIQGTFKKPMYAYPSGLIQKMDGIFGTSTRIPRPVQVKPVQAKVKPLGFVDRKPAKNILKSVPATSNEKMLLRQKRFGLIPTAESSALASYKIPKIPKMDQPKSCEEMFAESARWQMMATQQKKEEKLQRKEERLKKQQAGTRPATGRVRTDGSS